MIDRTFFDNLDFPSQNEHDQQRHQQVIEQLDWLRRTDLGSRYDGKFIAVSNFRVIATGNSQEEVETILQQTPDLNNKLVIIHFIPFKDQVVTNDTDNNHVGFRN